MEVTARLASLGEVKQFESGFMLQEFYLDATRFNQTTGEKYSNYIKLQNANERLDLSPIDIGDMVKVEFGVSGRFYANQEGESRHSQNLNAYKIEIIKKDNELPSLEQGIQFPY